MFYCPSNCSIFANVLQVLYSMMHLSEKVYFKLSSPKIYKSIFGENGFRFNFHKFIIYAITKFNQGVTKPLHRRWNWQIH